MKRLLSTYLQIVTGSRRSAVFVVLAWVVVAGVLNAVIPQIEVTVQSKSAPFVPPDLPAVVATNQMAADFRAPPTSAVGSVVITDEHGLNDADKAYYVELVRRLIADKNDVSFVIDAYGNPATENIAVSPDHKCVTLTVAGRGDVGSTIAKQSTAAIRNTINGLPKPPGLDAHFTGGSPIVADLFTSIDQSLVLITGVSVALIALLVFVAYRRIATPLIPLCTLGLSLAISRAVASWLGQHGVIAVSNFSIAILSAMVLGAGTDYAIFLVGSFHEARRKRRSPEDSCRDAILRSSPIIMASALTIAAACVAMGFTKIGMFNTAGTPTAISVVVTWTISSTFTPALLRILGERGWIDPRGAEHTERAWRRRGAWIVRRAGPLTAASLAVLVILAVVLPTMRLGFDEGAVQLHPTDSTKGYAAVVKHFKVNDAVPVYVMVRANHDLRDTRDLAALELAAIEISKLPMVAYVRSITRPDGKPIPEASTGYQTNAVADQLGDANKQLIAASPQLDQLARGVTQLSDGANLAVHRMPELVNGTGHVVAMANAVLDVLDSVETIGAITDDAQSFRQAVGFARSNAATLDAAAGSLRETGAALLVGAHDVQNVFGPLMYGQGTGLCSLWPDCAAAQKAFADLDRATGGQVSAALQRLFAATSHPEETMARLDALLPRIDTAIGKLKALTDGLNCRSKTQARQDLAALVQGVRTLSTELGTMADGLTRVKRGTDQIVALTNKLSAGLGEATDYLHNLGAHTMAPNGGFYLPSTALHDSRFVQGSKLLISPDGRTARILVTLAVNPYGQTALDHVNDVAAAAIRGFDGTGLQGAQVTLTGATAMSEQMRQQVASDFLLFSSVALAGVLIVLFALLRCIVAPVLILGAIVLSFAAIAGLSTLVWQHLIGIDLDWSVMPVAFMALIAVGADYSLLFATRIREESRQRGHLQGLLRGIGTTGGVITTAGLVFAVTMFALMAGTVVNLVQLGFTIGCGLMLDIFVVRMILLPSATVLMGNTLWWPSRQ